MAKSRRQRRAARPRSATESPRVATGSRDAAGETIADLRRQSGLTQVELAGKLAASQRAVSHVEHEPNPRIDTLASYLAALGGRLELRVVFAERTIPLHLPDRR